MPPRCLRPRAALALGVLLAAPVAARAQDPDVDEAPSAGAVCPAIAESYELCRGDPLSGDCRDFVAAADALSRLYLFNVEREPGRAAELQATIWWGCGSASFADQTALLERIGSPAARAVLARSPYREIAAASPSAPAASAARKPAGAAPSVADCSADLPPADQDACEQRELAGAQAAYRSAVARCEARLTPFLRDQLVAAETAWQRDRNVECAPGETETGCLARATRERTDDILRSHPECAGGKDAPVQAVGEGPTHGGPRNGMLEARWTPPQGKSREVPFSFESLGGDTSRGTMRTTLGDGGERFEGDYLRVQLSTKGDLITAMSVSWSGPEWELWKHDPDGSWTEEGVSVGEFAHFYTGKVIATLRGDRGHAMRCQLSLGDPDAGLLEGGTGRCQVTDGGRLHLGP